MPDPVRPAQPVPAPEPDDQPVRAGWRELGRPSRRRVIALLAAAGTMVVLLCFASGWFADSRTGTVDLADKSPKGGPEQPAPAQTAPARAAPAQADRTKADPAKADRAKADRTKAGGAKAQPAEIAADRVGTGKADAARAAADKVRAEKLAAAQAADARAAQERAADHRKRIIVMPQLTGSRLNDAMDLATDAGLTAVTVCHTPGGDAPLWWSNWHVTAQDVPAGARISAGQEVCLSAAKR